MAYASQYYDPVKAHEYYEAHKQLKGRTSTKGLNEAGKAAAKYVKDQIKAEKKAFNDKMKEILKQRIAELKEQLKGASKEERAAAIQQLRDNIKSVKEKAKSI